MNEDKPMPDIIIIKKFIFDDVQDYNNYIKQLDMNGIDYHTHSISKSRDKINSQRSRTAIMYFYTEPDALAAILLK